MGKNDEEIRLLRAALASTFCRSFRAPREPEDVVPIRLSPFPFVARPLFSMLRTIEEEEEEEDVAAGILEGWTVRSVFRLPRYRRSAEQPRALEPSRAASRVVVDDSVIWRVLCEQVVARGVE